MQNKTLRSIAAIAITTLMASSAYAQELRQGEFERIMGNAGMASSQTTRPTSVPLFVAFHSGAFGMVPMVIDYNLARDYRIWTRFYKPRSWDQE